VAALSEDGTITLVGAHGEGSAYIFTPGVNGDGNNNLNLFPWMVIQVLLVRQ